MGALVAVMIMVSVGTMDWHSLAPATLRRMPIAETTVMLVTVAVTVVTHNLTYGVIVGVLVAMVAFAHRAAHSPRWSRSTSPTAMMSELACAGCAGNCSSPPATTWSTNSTTWGIRTTS